ncbi:putative helicase [Bartonella japonica]|uniref:Helicase n=1 Tax=Bartonella japonica TaxID=357761 RepID=A0ABV2FP71_9HYPH
MTASIAVAAICFNASKLTGDIRPSSVFVPLIQSCYSKAWMRSTFSCTFSAVFCVLSAVFCTHAERKSLTNIINDFINTNSKKISWSRALKKELIKGKFFEFENACLAQGLYRPFIRQWLYYSRTFNEMISQMPRIFPIGQVIENRVIQVASVGTRSRFSIFMTNNVPDFNMIDGGNQCFPRYLYENDNQSHLFANATEKSKSASLKRHDAITDEGLAHFKAAYPNETITKDDLFYYVYGILYSEDYRTRYAHNLCKELPRIPCVKSADDFWKFVQQGVNWVICT